jgi:hypothetical protein
VGRDEKTEKRREVEKEMKRVRRYGKINAILKEAKSWKY